MGADDRMGQQGMGGEGSMEHYVFVDCEASGPCPGKGELTEFGAVHYVSRETFHGVLFESEPSAANPALSVLTGKSYDPVPILTELEAWLKRLTGEYCIFVSDNPAFDFQWINYVFHHTLGRNPFGHSARRIGDFYAGLIGDFTRTQGWKRLRTTPHDHDPVHDAMGNAEALARLLAGER